MNWIANARDLADSWGLTRDVITSCVDNNTMTCTSLQTVKFFAWNSLAVVKTEIKWCTCRYVCCRWQWPSHTWSQWTNECLWIRSQSEIKVCFHSQCCCKFYRTWNRSNCNPLNQPGDWDEGPQNHQLLCPMQCCMNDVLINEVPKILAPLPSETMHTIKI